MVHMTRPEKLHPFIQEVRRIEQNLAERRTERTKGWTPHFPRKQNKSQEQQTWQQTKKPWSNTQPPGPMEIDATKHASWPKGSKTGAQEKTPTKGRKFKCFNCGKVGHYAQDCRGDKRKAPLQQLNMMRHRAHQAEGSNHPLRTMTQRL